MIVRRDFLKEKSFIFIIFTICGFYILLFAILPLYGLTLGFKEFSYSKGIFSSWNGLKNFRYLWEDKTFKSVLLNTFKIGFFRSVFLLIFSFLVSIVLTGTKNKVLFSLALFIILLPGFLSWVVISSIFKGIFSQYGIINTILHKSPGFFSQPKYFSIVLYSSILWKESGFIILLMTFALRSIDSGIIDAAKLDGAGGTRLFCYIKLPLLKEQFILIIIFILLGFSSGAFEAIFNFYNPALYEQFDILDTYIYRLGIASGKISLGVALEIIKSAINICIVILIIFKLSKSFHTQNPFSLPQENENKKFSKGYLIGTLCVTVCYMIPFLILLYYTFFYNLKFSFHHLVLILDPIYLCSLFISFCTSFCGAILSTFLTILFSYGIYLMINGRGKINKTKITVIFSLFFFLLLINGGIVSLYILMRYLGLRNTYFSLFLPYLFNFIFLMYYLEELKRLDTIFLDMLKNDGASVLRTFFHINWGINKQSIVNLFILFFISHWNNWYAGVLFIDYNEMIPVNVFLRNIIAFDTNYNSVGITSTYYNLHEKLTFVFFSILPVLLCFIVVQYANKFYSRRR